MGRSSSLQGGTVDHSDLEKRDIADQHTTASVSGLDTIIADFDVTVNNMREREAGFLERDEVTLDFDFATGLLSIIPVGVNFTIWSEGVKHVFTTTQTITIPKDALIRNVYFDVAGQLQTAIFPLPSNNTLIDKTQVCAVSVNVDESKFNQIFDLRYTADMSPTTRKNFLNHHGTNYTDGFELQTLTLDGDGSTDDQTQFSVVDGVANISDVYHFSTSDTQQLTFPANILMFYLEGTSWKVKPVDDYPFIGEGHVASYTDTKLAYNPQNELGEGQLVECQEGWYVNVHYFATTGLDSTIIGLMGMREYPTIDNARNGGQNELQAVLSIPYWFTFTTCIGSVIYQTSDTYTNTGHARIVTTDVGTEYIDNRGHKDDIIASNHIVPSFKDTEFNIYNDKEFNFKFNLDAIEAQTTPEVIWTPSEDNIDFRTVPQYKLVVKAATPLTQFDDISLNINGDAQAYPATGGESTSEFTTRNLIDSTMTYIGSGSGIVMYQEDTTNQIFMKAGTANQVGGVDWGTEIEITGFSGTVHEMNATSMTSYYCAFCFVTTSNYLYAIICSQSSGTITHGSVYVIQTGSVISADIAYNPSRGDLMFTMAYGTYVYSGYTIPSGHNPVGNRGISWFSFTNFPECVKVQLAYNYYDNCIQGITATGDVYWGEAYIRESFGTVYYDDLTNVRLVVSGAQELGGISAYNNNMFGMVK
ncbi:MAG TPA: hypothetical protein ENK70_07200, partial [Methylophaga sp.]|nr:hypothetical protein [Methylophaga sp.]